MSAIPYAEPSAVDTASFVASEQNGRSPEIRQERVVTQTSLQSLTSSVMRLQMPSPWAVSGLRRCFDFVIALLAILIASPIFVIAAALVRLTSPGPVLFRQKRMGRHGEEFTLYKFRSMREEEEPGSWITVSGDSRVTPIGSFLRRFKLDELPQFWNVLRGEMSLVGPRPKLPHHEALFMSVRPGITGPATLAFRHEETFLLRVPSHELELFYEIFIKPTKARIDFEYMRSATFGSDVKLLWTTVVSCVGSSREEYVPLIFDGDAEGLVTYRRSISTTLFESWH